MNVGIIGNGFVGEAQVFASIEGNGQVFTDPMSTGPVFGISGLLGTGGGSFTVNSAHHQGVSDPGSLSVSATAEHDGLIEAVSIKDYRAFGLGIQWHAEFHPERDENSLNRVLFEKFGESCRAYKSRKHNRENQMF